MKIHGIQFNLIPRTSVATVWWRRLSHIGLLCLTVAASACGHRDSATQEATATAPAGDVLVSLDREKLTADQLRRQIPGGLSAEDSTKLARTYINAWIDRQLVLRVAPRELDTEEIDRLTEEYRRELIAEAYRRHMFDTGTDSTAVGADSLRGFYDAHAGDFRLDRPLVRGIYLKVPDNARNLNALRRLYRSDRQEDIDRLEKEVLSSAIQYDYFRDRWIDWEQIENRIPYDFGTNPSAFLASHRSMETSAGGSTYLLSISDYLPAGETMPYDVAKPIVRRRVLADLRRRSDIELRRRLYDKATADGSLKIYTELDR